MARSRLSGPTTLNVRLPARRAGCRPAFRSLDEPLRMYVAGRDEGTTVIDVLDGDGVFVEQWRCDADVVLAHTVLRDATGHPPRPATTQAFVDEVLDALPGDGFAISSAEVCAWLLLRAIERASR
jgi:hypothetical protein